jgi:Fe-S cluster assembly protein SufD
MLLRFAGEGAEADLSGLMLAGDGQLNDIHLDIRHDVPGCRSKESFKSILDGRGKVVFDGKIVVARDAQHTDAELSNHNLMLSRSAEVDTKPQLEIFADDVKCSHGTTVGELDANMLFYLRSRGIPQDKAVRMLCQGFAQDVLNGFETEALQQRALRLLDARLVSAGAGQGD